MSRVFVPGWGAPASVYAVPRGWTVLDPPPADSVEARLRWVRDELALYDEPVTLAGHSLGAAVAVLAALAEPHRVERLLLFSPAGLPLTKPVRESMRDFAGQIRDRIYPVELAVRALAALAASPRAAARLAQSVRGLDLAVELAALAVPTEVVACVGDTLTPVAHCRRVADLARAAYRELDAPGGHMWMLADPGLFAASLS
jgi:pimeloyl-ACP methyl ester carboxylesterase